MGASLLAIAVCQLTGMSTDTASSRSGTLPHWFSVRDQASSATTAARALAGSAAWLIGRPITR
ncbi:hypothetical protein FGE05_24745 [Pseudomonas sp. ICMP22404]|nr:hypothetical protein FGE05_24745 [Pseudomonas sp. ICMP22404]